MNGYIPNQDVYVDGTPQTWELDLAAMLNGRRMMPNGSTRSGLPKGLSAPTAWLGALGLSCLSLACARTSEERVLAIARLLDEARSYHAEQYVPDAFARAEELLARTRAEQEAQRGRPWFLGTHRRARQLLMKAETAASMVRAEAAAAVVRARSDASQAVTGAHEALDRASEAYWRSPRGKDTWIEILKMRSDLDALLESLTEAELALEKGEFLLSLQLASEVRSEAGKVATAINRATAYRIDDPARVNKPGEDLSGEDLSGEDQLGDNLVGRETCSVVEGAEKMPEAFDELVRRFGVRQDSAVL